VQLAQDPVANDPVQHPKHYNFGAVEVITAIDAWSLGFALGNAVKYIARAGRKDGEDPIEALEKAMWYLNHHITKLKLDRNGGT
jgi:hypothetical protein